MTGNCVFLLFAACNVTGVEVPHGTSLLDSADNCTICTCENGVYTCDSTGCGKCKAMPSCYFRQLSCEEIYLQRLKENTILNILYDYKIHILTRFNKNFKYYKFDSKSFVTFL